MIHNYNITLNSRINIAKISKEFNQNVWIKG
jgi:hypothetical protein